MATRSTKQRPRVVGVIASRDDLERALRMRRPPDLFELRLDRREVEFALEVPLLHILDPMNHRSRTRELGAVTVQVSDIPYHDHNIWGATAGMLMSLYRLLQSE